MAFIDRTQLQYQKMEGVRLIAQSYKVLKPLFQVNNYLYSQVCCLKDNYQLLTAIIYIYENEDPALSLKMLEEKLEVTNTYAPPFLIFPSSHVKDTLSDKKVTLFIIDDCVVPLSNYEKKGNFTVEQILQILHGSLTCLNTLHQRQILHGKISSSTTYLVKKKGEKICKFAFSVLDTSYFADQDFSPGIQESLFQSEGQSLGLKVSYKDDLESLLYVIVHLLSRGRLFTLQRFQLQWLTTEQFLRWKTCDFFREMVNIVPKELDFLIDMYTMIKSLARNEKPDYLKLIKKVLNVITIRQKQRKNSMRREDISTRMIELNKKNENTKRLSELKGQQRSELESKSKIESSSKQKLNQPLPQINENLIIIHFDEDEEQINLTEKMKKLNTKSQIKSKFSESGSTEEDNIPERSQK